MKTAVQYAHGLAVADAFVRRIDFVKTTCAPANGGSVWAISEQTLMFIPAGHKLRISLNSGATGVGLPAAQSLAI